MTGVAAEIFPEIFSLASRVVAGEGVGRRGGAWRSTLPSGSDYHL